MRSAAVRITLNLAEIGRLAQHRTIAYRINGVPIEVGLESGITPKLLIGAMVDLLNGEPVGAPSDPPQAREFLRRPRGKEK